MAYAAEAPVALQPPVPAPRAMNPTTASPGPTHLVVTEPTTSW